MNKSDFAGEFKCPGNEYRSIPFWAWNDKLDAAEIKNQIRQMKACGIGGFFIHSRDGLETEYLSDEWLSCVRAAVDEAKMSGMHAWLYDEDRWPSGSCGGAVSKAEKNSCKGLTLEVCRKTPCGIEGNVLAVYAAVIDGDSIYSFRRTDTDKIGLKDNEVLLIARLEVSGGSEWFNYSPPPDNLNPGTVSEFIQSTHEVYRREFGAEFGSTIPGIFTDEPSLADRHAAFNPKRGWIPWTYGFGEYFKELYGYDALDVIPYLYFSGSGSRSIRHDYWRAVAMRFKESYTDQIAAWCRRNKLAFTGHFLQEDKLGLSCRVNGSVMPHYAEQSVPAIDLLTERCDEYLTVKQCSSVASQMGADAVLAETYGCTGWDFSFEGQKWIGNWLYALGVNRRCQHLALYSLRGCRKRDYPPSINYNNSWWSEYRTVEDYFARLGYMLRRGRAVRNVLVIHPMSTAWSKVGCSPYGNPKRSEERDIPYVNKLGDRYNALIKGLCCRHYDCDIGDEEIIRLHGRGSDDGFRVGECLYSTMIVPFCESLLSSTLDKLVEYADCGGRVIGVKPFADYIEGKRSARVLRLLNHKNFVGLNSEAELYSYLQGHVKRTVSVVDDCGEEAEDILYQLREEAGGYILYIINNNREADRSVRIALDVPIEGASVYCMNPLSGEIFKTSAEERGGRIYINCNMRGCADRLYYITEREAKYKFGKPVADIADNSAEVPLNLVGYNTDSPNVLTLDFCRYKLGGTQSEAMEVWRAQCEIRGKLGMRQINLNGIEQRYRWINTRHPNDGAQAELEFEFSTQTDVSGAMLVLERPERFEINLDGEAADSTPVGYYLDKSFKTVALPHIKKGRHHLTLRCRYTNDTELENCYIIGEFGVSREREITKKPQNIRLGDICGQGFLHYAGGIDYIFECEFPGKGRVVLDVREFKGTCAAAYINGSVIPLPWKADGIAEVTDYLQNGKNRIVIKVIGSPRNMLGPLHITDRPVVTKDSCFCPAGSNYTSGYVTAETGLYSAPRLMYL